MSLNPCAPLFSPSKPPDPPIHSEPFSHPTAKILLLNDENSYLTAFLHEWIDLEKLEIDARNQPIHFDAFHSFPHLTQLTITDSDLPNPTIFFHNRELQSLSLISTQLEKPPILSNNPKLRHLCLSMNRLKTAPRLEGNALLETLDLSHNQLQKPPDISWTPYLKQIDLSYNCLTDLNDEMMTLSSDCCVRVSNNDFHPDYVSSFQQRLREHRKSHPGQGPTFYFEPQEDSCQSMRMLSASIG